MNYLLSHLLHPFPTLALCTSPHTPRVLFPTPEHSSCDALSRGEAAVLGSKVCQNSRVLRERCWWR